MKLIMGFAAAPLTKIARVISEDQLRENRTKAYNEEVQNTMTFKFKSKEFDNKESALEWLASAEDWKLLSKMIKLNLH